MKRLTVVFRVGIAHGNQVNRVACVVPDTMDVDFLFPAARGWERHTVPCPETDDEATAFRNKFLKNEILCKLTQEDRDILGLK